MPAPGRSPLKNRTAAAEWAQRRARACGRVRVARPGAARPCAPPRSVARPGRCRWLAAAGLRVGTAARGRERRRAPSALRGWPGRRPSRDPVLGARRATSPATRRTRRSTAGRGTCAGLQACAARPAAPPRSRRTVVAVARATCSTRPATAAGDRGPRTPRAGVAFRCDHAAGDRQPRVQRAREAPYCAYFGARAGDGGARASTPTTSAPGTSSCSTATARRVVRRRAAQERWLRADLAAHPTRCTLAYWHHPRFSSGEHGDNRERAAAAGRRSTTARADVVLVGHDHHYERFAPSDARRRAPTRRDGDPAVRRRHRRRDSTGSPAVRPTSECRATAPTSACCGWTSTPTRRAATTRGRCVDAGGVVRDAGTGACRA